VTGREWRLACAVFLGVVLDAVCFWKFQPYSAREHSPELLPWYFLPVATFAAGLALGIGFEAKKRWIPFALFAGFAAANAGLIVMDCMADPTNHNLWPFEFVMIGLATAAAFIGTALSVWIDRSRRPQN